MKSSGNPAAAPQVSALAYHLYSKYPNIGQPNYRQVWAQIVQYRGTAHWPLKGIVNFQDSIDNW